ncbi:MAG: methyltransferase domain-containing protein [Crocinitomicaceae bacterium]|nr:methyltransferase domain-containing protein [Crocinitomicaceae bacterium]MBK8924893.1 methyltransferase domain-containing protein [Crocinitomicaceae bacterium]
MEFKTEQTDFWSGNFGKDYTERNLFTESEWDSYYLKQYGLTKLEMNDEFIGNLPKDAKILEVGCNIGMQLRGLQSQGFTNLYGIELQWYGVERSKELLKGINIIQGSGFDIPFRDNYFDVVVTNGVLIHISPNDYTKIMSEIYRCSKKYIWGFEYFADQITEINYRGNTGFLWKADFAKEFQNRFSDLKMVKTKLYPYINQVESGNTDAMYLLSK